MPKSPLEKTVESGISFLSKIFPLQSYLYFPLLNASLFWAIKRTKEWKEKIFSWKVWLDPERVQLKPDDFILSFFRDHPALMRCFEPEIRKKDMASLRGSFARLYPILGLEDPFLSALFYEEMESGDYRKIVKEFDQKVSQAEKDISGSKNRFQLIKGLKDFAEEMVSLSLELISQEKVQNVIAEIIKKQIRSKNG
jgi:hypothetical protein